MARKTILVPDRTQTTSISGKIPTSPVSVVEPPWEADPKIDDVAACRSKLGLTVRQLANLLGTDERTILKCEGGQLEPDDRMKGIITKCLSGWRPPRWRDGEP